MPVGTTGQIWIRGAGVIDSYVGGRAVRSVRVAVQFNCAAGERRRIGYVPQGRAIFPSLSVLENLRVTQFAQGKGSARVEELIELLPALKPHLSSRGGGLSGGQQRAA